MRNTRGCRRRTLSAPSNKFRIYIRNLHLDGRHRPDWHIPMFFFFLRRTHSFSIHAPLSSFLVSFRFFQRITQMREEQGEGRMREEQGEDTANLPAQVLGCMRVSRNDIGSRHCNAALRAYRRSRPCPLCDDTAHRADVPCGAPIPAFQPCRLCKVTWCVYLYIYTSCGQTNSQCFLEHGSPPDGDRSAHRKDEAGALAVAHFERVRDKSRVRRRDLLRLPRSPIETPKG